MFRDIFWLLMAGGWGDEGAVDWTSSLRSVGIFKMY
jgi:hypothetical protein